MSPFLAQEEHQVSYTITGNPIGQPFLIIHGGPGSGSSRKLTQLLDHSKYKIIQIDQRGCGNSKPLGKVVKNTTQDLIQDIENIREILEIEKWDILGGSWGASLGVLYTAKHPNTVDKLILRNTFLCTKKEIDDFFKDIDLQSLLDDINSKDPKLQIASAQRWLNRENELSEPKTERGKEALITTETINKFIIQSHYIKNNFFINNETIEQEFEKIKNSKVYLLHGINDNVCPAQNSIKLHEKNPASTLILVSECGHDPFNKNMITALQQVLNG